MISIYTSAFNLIKNKFDYKNTLQKFSDFADEVVIAINSSSDDTLIEIQKLSHELDNLKVVSCDFSYEDPWMDGKIKNCALQNTTQLLKIGLDMDEYIPLYQKSLWLDLADNLLCDTYMCYMIASLNLYKDFNHYYSIGHKWYLHKSGLFRGPVNFARKSNGTVDTTKSDTCELIDKNGNLVKSRMFDNSIEALRQGKTPYVIHTGYVDLEARLIRNKNFWSQHWLTESGGVPPPHMVHESIEQFDDEPKEHLLKI
jgi:glycosyltransferase involved in cell wall biosynthesis